MFAPRETRGVCTVPGAAGRGRRVNAAGGNVPSPAAHKDFGDPPRGVEKKEAEREDGER